MATLIVYATKNGTTKKAAEKLSQRLGGCDIVNIAEKSFDLSKYDTVIIGSNIRMGTVDKTIRRFMLQFIKVLVEKKVAFFICCCFSENIDRYIEANVPPQLRERFVATGAFGGELDIARLRGADKMVAKMVTKADREKGIVRKFSIDESAIKHFAKEVTSVAQPEDD